MTPFEAFRAYVSVKNHFSQKKYNFFEKGLVYVPEARFKSRNDASMFYVLAKDKNPYGLLVSNFCRHDAWIGDILNARDVYNRWLKVRQSLGYFFASDLRKIERFDPSEIRTLMFHREIELETFVILANAVPNFYDSLDADDSTLWKHSKNRIQKYHPWIKYSNDEFHSIIRQIHPKIMLNSDIHKHDHT